MKLPCVKLVFEDEDIPLICMHDDPTIFLYEITIGHAQSPHDIFHTSKVINPTDYFFGSIVNSNIHDFTPLHTTPTIHVCTHPVPYKPTNKHNFINHISNVINKNNKKGLYSLKINTNIQNDSGAK